MRIRLLPLAGEFHRRTGAFGRAPGVNTQTRSLLLQFLFLVGDGRMGEMDWAD
jgi:hypothetical protein